MNRTVHHLLFTVVLVAVSCSTQRFVTRSYDVDPGVFETQHDNSCVIQFRHQIYTFPSRIDIERRDVEEFRQFLENCGVSFPPGSDIKIYWRKYRVVVRNTPENMKILDKVMDTLPSKKITPTKQLP